VLSARSYGYMTAALVSSRVVDVTHGGDGSSSNERLTKALNGVALPLFGGDLSVLARSEEAALMLRRELVERVPGRRPAWLFPRLRPVGEGHLRPPSAWEPFIEQDGERRRFLNEAGQNG
jgi:hypothetical protein